ncbi:MAG TPA: hypothetical protein VMW68_06850 [Methyloceanibacter sp.]|nr:hypothetical protein [Methyloceanibacter sp.]
MAGSGAQPPVGAGSLDKDLEPSRREAAEYIASMLDGLRLVAHQAQLPFLSYLISVAAEEANNEKKKRD